MNNPVNKFIKTDKTSKNDTGDMITPIVGGAVAIGMLGMASRMFRGNDEPKRYETKEEHKARLAYEKTHPPRRGLFGGDRDSLF